MGAKGYITECPHVGRPHYAKGRCHACWKKARRSADPVLRERQRLQMEQHLARRGMTHADRHREWRFRSVYGISFGDYDRMVEAQGNLCAICAGPPNGPGKRLQVDHDHTSGAVRGLLCSNCNTAIGLLQDSPAVAQAVAHYLTQAQSAWATSQGRAARPSRP